MKEKKSLTVFHFFAMSEGARDDAQIFGRFSICVFKYSNFAIHNAPIALATIKYSSNKNKSEAKQQHHDGILVSLFRFVFVVNELCRLARRRRGGGGDRRGGTGVELHYRPSSP